MIAGRNGVVYVCVSDGSGQQGEVRGIHPGTGELVFRPDYNDLTRSAPAMSPDGTLVIVSPDMSAPTTDGSHITAISTGSKGGIAQSPWPRSTGGNLNPFREQGVEDSDQDGLTDDQEATVYGTNPLIADTDGDGYSDGKEVEQGSNPKDKTSIPELLDIEPAIKLTFGTTTGLRYRLQYSADLETWADMGAAFIGTGVRSSVLVEATEKARYFRLWRY